MNKPDEGQGVAYIPTERPPSGVGQTAAADWLGREVDGRYRVLRKLGEGGMGTVYEAEQRPLGKRVALKTIRPELAKDPELAERFAREAMATAHLDHPRIAAALDFGQLPSGEAYLVMHFARGVELGQLQQDFGARPFPVDLAVEIAAQIADALSAAHAAGIVHRDLKPDNVFVERGTGGQVHVRLVDFGVARIEAGGGPTQDQAQKGVAVRALTALGTVVGTPGYMAPEQAMGQPADARADLYALGVLLWEMLCGRPLFEGDDVVALISTQLTTQVTDLRPPLAALQLPAPLIQLVLDLLAQRPNARPGSATEVRRNLLQVAELMLLQRSMQQQADPGQPAPSATGVANTDGSAADASASAGAPAACPPNTALAGPAASHGAPGHALGRRMASWWTEGRVQTRALVAASTAASRRLWQQLQGSPWRTRLPGSGPRPPTGAQPARMAQRQDAVWIAAALAVIVLSALWLRSLTQTPAEDPAPRNDAAPSDTPKSAPAQAAPAVGERSRPKRPPKTATTRNQDSQPSAAEARAQPVPDAIAAQVQELLQNDSVAIRRKAAAWLRTYTPREPVPHFVRAVAELEWARGCGRKRRAIVTLRRLGDARSLPALQRLFGTPRRGCGLLKTRDCYA
ncbi:MAG: protein kinase domain-containing protein, partial [Polyangiales bacterium]